MNEGHGEKPLSLDASTAVPLQGAERAPVRTLLVSGFLGAGKTTFILEHLKHSGARVAVLVNEYGSLGIDGAVIRAQGGIDVVEMPGGCICCSQKEGLTESIRRIVEQLQPELLLIEPSGVAEISEVLKLLRAPSLKKIIRLDATITVLDAETFLEYSEPENFGSFFLDQVMHADLILLNKADLVEESLLAATELRIAGINPTTLVQRTEFCRMGGKVPTGGNPAPLTSRAPLPMLECVSIVPGRELSEGELELFLQELTQATFGRVLRGKGFVPVRGKGCVNLQIVAGSGTAEPFRWDGEPRVTLIGSYLNRELLRVFFNAAA